MPKKNTNGTFTAEAWPMDKLWKTKKGQAALKRNYELTMLHEVGAITAEEYIKRLRQH